MCGMFHLREAAFYQMPQMSLLATAYSKQLKKDSSHLISVYICKIFIQLESVLLIVKIKGCQTLPQFSQPSIVCHMVLQKSTCATFISSIVGLLHQTNISVKE